MIYVQNVECFGSCGLHTKIALQALTDYQHKRIHKAIQTKHNITKPTTTSYPSVMVIWCTLRRQSKACVSYIFVFGICNTFFRILGRKHISLTSARI